MIHQFDGQIPNVHKNSFIASSADVIGNVFIGEYSNIWFGAVLRGDMDSLIYRCLYKCSRQFYGA